MQDFGEEISFKKDGIIVGRAQEVLEKGRDLIKEIEVTGMFETLEKGKFAGIKRPIDGGKGLSGVFVKDTSYFNPFIELMTGGEK